MIDLGVLPTPGVAWLCGRAGLSGRGGLGLAQPLRRQRHQALRGRRAQAPRRHRGRGRGGARPGARPGRSPSPSPDRPRRRGLVEEPRRRRRLRRASRGGSRRARPHGHAGRGRLRQRRGVDRGPRGPRAPGRGRWTPSPNEPDGANINDGCGSTHPEALAAEVVARGAELGLALDGDADRLLAVDHTGAVSHRRRAAVAVRHRPRRPWTSWRGNTVVVTVMTNLGFRLAMAERGIAVRETQVGDRYCPRGAQRRRAHPRAASSRGTSSSGSWRPPVTACSPGSCCSTWSSGPRRRWRSWRRGRCSGSRRCCSTWPRRRPARCVAAPAVQAEVAAVEVELGTRGRVLLRASGTEPLVRVMVEADGRGRRCAAAQRLCAVVEKALRRGSTRRGGRPTWSAVPA